MKIKQFGNEVIERLLEGESDTIKTLKEQFKNSKIKKEEYTGSGFFIHYFIDPEEERLKIKDIEISSICKINNTSSIYDIILFIRNGAIDFLEGVAFGDEKFPNKIESYQLVPSEEDIKRLIKNNKNLIKEKKKIED